MPNPFTLESRDVVLQTTLDAMFGPRDHKPETVTTPVVGNHGGSKRGAA